VGRRVKERGIAPLIIVAIVAVAAVAVVGIVLVARRGGGGIAGATSLDIKMTATSMGQTLNGRFRAKNIGSSNLKLRVDENLGSQEIKLIVDGSTQKAWMWSSYTAVLGWQDVSSMFQTILQQFENLKGQLSGWTEGDWTYTDPTTGMTARLYDIVVNPDLPDSLFLPEGGGLENRPVSPSAYLSFVAENTSESTYKLTISHQGGDDLAVNDLEIQASDSDTTMATYAFPGTGTFSVGEQAILENCTYNEPVEGKVITVKIIYVPSGGMFYRASIVVR